MKSRTKLEIMDNWIAKTGKENSRENRRDYAAAK